MDCFLYNTLYWDETSIFLSSFCLQVQFTTVVEEDSKCLCTVYSMDKFKVLGQGRAANYS